MSIEYTWKTLVAKSDAECVASMYASSDAIAVCWANCEIEQLQQHIKKLKQQVERAIEIEAAAVEKYFTKLQKEYEPYGLLKTYTAFDVAKHIGAQGKHFAEQIRQQATGEN